MAMVMLMLGCSGEGTARPFVVVFVVLGTVVQNSMGQMKTGTGLVDTA